MATCVCAGKTITAQTDMPHMNVINIAAATVGTRCVMSTPNTVGLRIAADPMMDKAANSRKLQQLGLRPSQDLPLMTSNAIALAAANSRSGTIQIFKVEKKLARLEIIGRITCEAAL
jgi:hypothetical protein